MPSLPGIRDSVALSLPHSMRYRDGLLPHISSPLYSSLFPSPLPPLYSVFELLFIPWSIVGISVEMKFDNLHSMQPLPANLSLPLSFSIYRGDRSDRRLGSNVVPLFQRILLLPREENLIDALSPRSSIITFDYICYSRSAESWSRGFRSATECIEGLAVLLFLFLSSPLLLFKSHPVFRRERRNKKKILNSHDWLSCTPRYSLYFPFLEAVPFPFFISFLHLRKTLETPG